jgi:hypothetical protein
MEERGNEGMGEGWPKTVGAIAMPAVDAVATNRRRKTKPAHEGGGSSLPPSAIATTMTTADPIFLVATK